MIRVFCYILLFSMVHTLTVSAVSSARYQVLTGEEGSGPEISWVIITAGPDNSWQMDLFEGEPWRWTGIDAVALHGESGSILRSYISIEIPAVSAPHTSDGRRL